MRVSKPALANAQRTVWWERPVTRVTIRTGRARPVPSWRARPARPRRRGRPPGLWRLLPPPPGLVVADAGESQDTCRQQTRAAQEAGARRNAVSLPGLHEPAAEVDQPEDDGADAVA